MQEASRSAADSRGASADAQAAAHPSRVVRRRLRDEHIHIPLKVMCHGLGWVIGWLRRRCDRSASWVAHRTDRGPQTVRDIEDAKHKDFYWGNAYLICGCLHRPLSYVEELTRRYLVWDHRRHCRLHHDEPGWVYHYPWSKKRTKPRIRRRKP